MSSPEQKERPAGVSLATFLGFLKRNWFYIFALFYLLIIGLQFSPVLLRAFLWLLLLIAVFLITGSLLLIGLWHIPRWQVKHIQNVEPHDLFTLENEARKTTAQVIGGILLLISFYFTWEMQSITQESIEKTQRTAQEGQITDRFSKAIVQLGDEKPRVRLGGIYALERVSKDSEKDHWPIMEILTAYVHEEASWPPKEKQEECYRPCADIQAVLTVIGRRKQSYQNGEPRRLDLRRTDLRNINLDGANLREVDLEGANLQGASLREANLANANLRGADLSNATLILSRLKGANLEETIMNNTLLNGVNIDDVDLEKVIGLKWEQIDRADSRYRTIPKLPADLRERWRTEKIKRSFDSP